MVREQKQKFIQLECFAPSICASMKARINKFVQGVQFALKVYMASQRSATMAEVVAAACITEEVLSVQYRTLNKKEKTKDDAASLTNPKPTQNQNQQPSKNGDNNKRKRNGNGMVTKMGTTNHFIRTARGDMMGNA